jgi:hypothetical protein
MWTPLGDGFPDNPDPSRSLFVTFSNHPDFHDDFRFDRAGYIEPALLDRGAPNGPAAVPNPEEDGEAELQVGNLDFSQTNCVHTVEDVPLARPAPAPRASMGCSTTPRCSSPSWTRWRSMRVRPPRPEFPRGAVV